MTETPAVGEQDFHFGAAVHADDGREVGTLVRLVVDGESWEPVGIVVHERARLTGHALGSVFGMFPDEVAVPIDSVRSATRERVELDLSVAEFRRLPPYLYEQPAPEAPARATAASLGRAAGFSVVSAGHQVADKPAGAIEIRRADSVMVGHQGRRLGRVHDVVFDDGELAGAVVRVDGEGGGEVLVPVRFFDRSDDGALFVAMSEEQVVQLRRADGESDGPV